MNIKILFMSTFCCAFTPFVASLAQERPHDEALFSEVLKDKDPKAIARERTDEMNHLLALSDKQYKKVYKLFLKEEKKRSENSIEPEAFHGNRPPMDQMPGEPPRGKGGPRPEFAGEMPPPPPHPEGISPKEREKTEKKLRKSNTPNGTKAVKASIGHMIRNLFLPRNKIREAEQIYMYVETLS